MRIWVVLRDSPAQTHGHTAAAGWMEQVHGNRAFISQSVELCGKWGFLLQKEKKKKSQLYLLLPPKSFNA